MAAPDNPALLAAEAAFRGVVPETTPHALYRNRTLPHGSERMQPSITMTGVGVQLAQGESVMLQPIMRRNPAQLPYHSVRLPAHLQAMYDAESARVLEWGETEGDRIHNLRYIRNIAELARTAHLQDAFDAVDAVEAALPPAAMAAIEGGGPPTALFDELRQVIATAAPPPDAFELPTVAQLSADALSIEATPEHPWFHRVTVRNPDPQSASCSNFNADSFDAMRDSILLNYEGLRASLPVPASTAPLVRAHMRYIMSTMLGARFLMERALVERLVSYIRTRLDGHTPNLKISAQCRVRLISPMESAETRQYDAPCIGMTRVFRRNMSVLQIEAQALELLAELVTMMIERSYDLNSGLFILGVTELSLFMANILVLPAGSSFIPTPPELAGRHCTMNVWNTDDELCAKYTVGLAQYRLEHDGRAPLNYETKFALLLEYAARFNWSGIEFPMMPSDWDRFERQNPNYSVFVYEWERAGVTVNRVTVNRLPSNRSGSTHMIQLLLISAPVFGPCDASGVGPPDLLHYVLVTSVGRLFGVSGQGVCCPYCINSLTGPEFEDHVRGCREVCETQIKFPPPGSRLTFSDHRLALPRPVVFFADFECLLVPRDPDVTVRAASHHSGMGDNNGAQTDITHDHVPVSFVLHAQEHGRVPGLHAACPTVIVRHADPQALVTEFFRLVGEYTARCAALLAPTNANRHPSFNATVTAHMGRSAGAACAICDHPVVAPSPLAHARATTKKTVERGPIVWVDHFSGEFRGFVHRPCHALYIDSLRRPKFPCYFHNFAKYDVNLLISRLARANVPDLQSAFIIPRTMESITRLDCGGAMFCDSLQHMPASLERLIAQLRKRPGTLAQHFPSMRRELCRRYSRIPDIERKWELLVRKGVFPYEWFDSYAKLAFAGLPPIEAFTSTLGGGSTASAADYAFAQEVYSTFQCASFGDYHDLYLLVDGLALADVMSSHRRVAIASHGLDPTRFTSAPGWAFMAALRRAARNGMSVELISDPIVFDMVRRCIRGGVSVAFEPTACAENKFTRLAHGDASMEERATDSCINYFDACSLYATMMQQHMPVGEYEIIFSHVASTLSPAQAVEMATGLVANSADISNAAVGYLLEVDLETPIELHDKFDGFPLAPELMEVTADMLSPEQQETLQACMGSASSYAAKKLVPSLFPKRNYVCYGRTLDLYLQLGLRLTRVHRVLRFKQAPLFTAYISINAELRREAKLRGDDVASQAAKDASNVLYGKTIEDKLRQMPVTLVPPPPADATPEQREALRLKVGYMVARNTLVRAHPIGELWLAQTRKAACLMDRPMIIGAVILELAKAHMYRFYYRVVLPYLERRNIPCKVLYTDTDSLIIWAKTPDLLRELAMMDRESIGGREPAQAGDGCMDFSGMKAPICRSHSDHGLQHNMSVYGTFKVEHPEEVIEHYIGVRAKMYRLKMIDLKKMQEVKVCAAKGVPRDVRDQLDFEACLSGHGPSQYVTSGAIGASHGDLHSEKRRKIALHRGHPTKGWGGALFNDKRHIVPLSDHTFISHSLGHFSSYQ